MNLTLIKSLVAMSLAVAAGVGLAVPMEGPPAKATGKETEEPAAKPADISALVARLSADDWQARERAMRDLIALGEAARTALREARRSPDAETRWRATYALSLLDLTLEPIEGSAARTLYASAARARAQKDGQDAARTLYAEVVERFPNTRWASAARERLAALGADKAPKEQPPTPETVARLVAQLGRPDWRERQAASSRLAQLGEAARAALEVAAQTPDPEVAWRAANLLQRLQAGTAPEEPRGKREPKVMIEILGQGTRTRPGQGEPNDLDALVRSLAGDDARDIARAREVLLNVGEDAIVPLLRALENCDEPTAVEIIDLLRQITRQDIGFDPARWQAWWRARQDGGKE